MASDNATFIEQEAVQSVVRIAIDAIDKPGAASPPESAIQFYVDRYGREIVEKAIASCNELLASNPRDFTAAGALRLLENTLTV